MRNLIRRLKAAWLFSQNVQYRDLYPGFWDNGDARWLSNMFNTVHGRKLRQILTNLVSEMQMNACMPINRDEPLRHDPDFKRGMAYGMQVLIAELKSRMKISVASADSETFESTQSTGAESFEHLHP
jgi:hypothetical protein